MDNPAQILRAMADRIERNDPEDFAGCVVVIPPEGRIPGEESGNVVEILVIDPAQDLAHFWAVAKNQTRIAAEKWETLHDQQNRGGFR